MLPECGRHGALRLMMSYPRTILPQDAWITRFSSSRLLQNRYIRDVRLFLNTLGQNANWPNIVPILPNVAFQQGVI
jgi:hypothetical protein